MTGPNLPVDIDRTYPNSRVDASIRAHQLAHDALHRIVNTLDTSLGTAEEGQVLTWTGSSYKPATPASVPAGAGASRKSWEDAARAVYAFAPSAESQLQPIKADRETDDAPAIQRMLDYLKQTYGGGQLFLPLGRISRCNSTITIPAGVQVVGSETSEWDFWYAGTAATAIVVNDRNFTPIHGLRIHGIQWDANTDRANTTTSTGISITGDCLQFVNVQIHGFNWGVDLVHNNTYLVTFVRSRIDTCMVGVNLDLDHLYDGRSGSIDNSGERINFLDCVLANCGTMYWASGNGTGLFFSNTSMDFPRLWGRQGGGHVTLDNCHLESSYAGGRRHMFELSRNPVLRLTNCMIILGSPGIYHLLDTSQGPWNVGWGAVQYSRCDAYVSATPGAQAAGAYATGYSEALVPMKEGSLEVVVASPYVSRWNPARATVVAMGGGAADLQARVSAMDADNGTLTVTLSRPAPGGTFVEVSF